MNEEPEQKPAPKKGFAAMTAERRQEVSRQGAATTHKLGRAHRFTPAMARAAALKRWRKAPENEQGR